MFNAYFTLLLIIGLLLDQLTKFVAEAKLSFFSPLDIIPGILSLQLVHNRGAAYGLFEGKQTFLLAVSIIVILFCFIFQKKIGITFWSKYGVTFLMMGAIGNFIDRVFHGYVIDFIYIRIVPVFNFADVFINIAIICFVLDLI